MLMQRISMKQSHDVVLRDLDFKVHGYTLVVSPYYIKLL